MALAVCAYPKLKDGDYRKIQAFRKEYDRFYMVIEPHISFVFPIAELDTETFTGEVYDKSRGIRHIDFEIKCATVNKDALADYYHVLLVPEKGYSAIVKLHDRLYGEKLFPHLRLDIDFIPHMGIGNSADRYVVKKWVDDWNKDELSVTGTIDSLTILDFTDNILTDLHAIKLE